MAGLSAPGIGSGLDVNGLISQLMAVESQPLTKLDQREAGYQAEISGYGTLSSSLSSLQSTLDALKDPDTFTATTGKSTDQSVLKISTDTGIPPISYSITVDRLAQFHKTGSNEFASSDTFGGGAGDSLTLTVAGASFTVDLSTAKTLGEIQTAINDPANETGVTASIITGDNGNQTLVLTSGSSGYNKRVQLSFGGAIDATTFGFQTLNRDASGQLLTDDTLLDASLLVDGVQVTRGSNSISDVIEGVTLELQGTGQADAVISDDPSVATNAIDTFIKAYNDLKDQVATLADGTLKGNGILRRVESQLRGVLNQAFSGGGDISYLSELGITSNEKTGKLQLDSDRLNDALADSRSDVLGFFSDSDDGFAARLDEVVDGFIKSGGMIDSVTDGVNSRIERIGDQRESMQRRLESIERRYRAQFASLDTLMAQMTNTSDYLGRQLDALANMMQYNK